MKGKMQSPWLLVLLIGVGSIIGGLIGNIFQNSFKILSYGKTMGFQPFTLDLSIIQVTLGCTIYLNLASVIGIVIAIIIFNRM